MICTFYSFKGGVGRSMAMANVADILARRGLKVLMIDFDLEAPGLEQFFQMNQEGVRRNLGLLDLLLRYKQAMSLGGDDDAGFKRLGAFIRSVYEKLPGGGRLDILPAGQRQDPDQLARYALNLRTFDWQDFYFNWKGDLFFEWLRRSLTQRPPERSTNPATRGDETRPWYDLILADSRTGVTEMGGICGYQLADVIVIFCAANHQNLHGTANMVRDFRSAANLRLRAGRPLQIVIVPARIEQRSEALRDEFFRRFEEAFAQELPEGLRAAGLSFRDLMIPYEPHFAFEERVVSDPDLAAQRRPIASSFERLARAIAAVAPQGSAVARLGKAWDGATPSALGTNAEVAGRLAGEPPGTGSSAAVAAPVVAAAAVQYDPAKRFAGYDVFLDSSSPDRELAGRIVDALKGRGLQVFFDREDIQSGSDWRAVVEEALFHSRSLLFCIGAKGLTEWRTWTLERALAARARGQPLQIVPAMLPGSDFEMLRATPLSGLVALDLRDGFSEAEIEQVVRASRGGPREAPRFEANTRPPFPGPRPFDEPDGDLLFGRDTPLKELEERLRDGARLVVLAGASGSGKTSLVRAALVPRLRAGGANGPWAVTYARLSAEGRIEAVFPPDAPGRRLVVLDPLEEVVTPAGGHASWDWLRQVAEAVGEDGAALVVVRDDALARLGMPRTPAAVVKLAPMSPDELRRALEGPAERVGVAFEPGLAERIVEEMAAEPGALALLQDLLGQLWTHRRGGWLTNAAYERIGGLGRVAVSRAEKSFETLDAPEREALRALFLRLVNVTPSADDSRRRLPLDEALPAEGSETLGPMRSALAKFVDAGLLVATEENGRPVLKAAHDALLGWRELRKWIDQDRAFLLWHQRLASALDAWRDSGEKNGALLSGEALAEAAAKLEERRSALAPAEVAFIEQSKRLSRRRVGIAVAAALIAVVAILAAAAMVKRSAGEAAEAAKTAADTVQFGFGFVAQADALVEKTFEDRGPVDTRRKLLDDAIQLYDTAIALELRDPTFYAQRANAHLARGDLLDDPDARGKALSAADRDFTEALRLGANKVEKADREEKSVVATWYAGRGRARERQGNPTAALEDYQKATELQPQDDETWVDVGRLHEEIANSGRGSARDRQAAIEAYTRALQVNPASADALFKRGVARERAGQPALAIEDFSAVAKLGGADRQLVRAAAARLKSLGQQVPTMAAGPARVFVHYASEADREVVAAIVKALRAKQPLQVREPQMVALRLVGGRADVRYFHRQDERTALDVKELVETQLAKTGIAVRLELTYRDATRFAPPPPRGDLEVWLLPLTTPLPMKRAR